jgi:hypothetical protein
MRHRLENGGSDLSVPTVVPHGRPRHWPRTSEVIQWTDCIDFPQANFWSDSGTSFPIGGDSKTFGSFRLEVARILISWPILRQRLLSYFPPRCPIGPACGLVTSTGCETVNKLCARIKTAFIEAVPASPTPQQCGSPASRVCFCERQQITPNCPSLRTSPRTHACSIAPRYFR